MRRFILAALSLLCITPAYAQTISGSSCPSPVVTIGSTSINCGATTTTLSGLTSVTIGAGSALTSTGAGGALGTSAFVNTGTSGATVPLLNGTNTWSAVQTNTAQIVAKSGNSAATPDIAFGSSTSGFVGGLAAGSNIGVVVNSLLRFAFTNFTGAEFWVPSNGSINFADATSLFGTTATSIYRDATSILAQRNANNAQIFRIGYNFTDASNYSWGMIDAGQTTANTLGTGSRSVGSPGQKLTKWSHFVDGTLIIDYATTTAATLTMAPAVALGTLASDATHTDATVCRDTTSGLLLAGSGAAGICLGTSSIRFKHDIAPLKPGLAQIMALKPVSYRYNAGHGDPNKELYGFTAEQVAEVMPELVGRDAEGRPNSVDWAGVVPVLVKAIQELKEQRQ